MIIGDKGMSIIDRHLKEGPSYSQHTVSKEVGGFHLHLSVFPFVYQFNSRIGVLVKTSFANN